MNRSDLTPKMRQAVAVIRPGQDMRDLVHGATVSALIRKGLALREWEGGGDDRVYLTAAGVEVRAALRERVDELLHAHGFRPTGVGSLYSNPDEGGSCTRSGAMRRCEVTW